MRILRVISTVDPKAGGPIAGITQSNEYYRQQGVEIDVLCLDLADAGFVKTSPLNVIAIGPAKGVFGLSPKLIPWLEAHVHEYDCVIVHGLWQYCGFAVRQVCRSVSKPYYVFSHGMLDPWFKRRYPLKHLKKYLYWLLAEYWVLKHAKGVLFTTEQEKLLARQSFRPYSCNEQVVNYGTVGGEGYDSALFYCNYPELKQKKLLLFLSRIHPKKGADMLLKQLYLLPQEYHLVMAGPSEDQYAKELKAMVDTSGYGHKVTWVGMLQGPEKWSAFHAAEMFILPSHQENFGIVVAEALSCHLPVLITEQVNIYREVQSYSAGIVAPDTEAGTAELLRQYFALTHEQVLTMKAQAKRLFDEKFQIKSSVSSVLSILRGA